MSAAENQAVFLSYASQDAAAAKRICEALRSAGVEVWFDQNELVGGDAWDAKIRKQIKECALFVPIISAATQARTEGYFRLEWRIADQRTHLMAKGRPFLLPVVIDDTRDADAHVPDSFTEVQWTRLMGGETSTAFCVRVKKLLGGDVAESVNPGPASALRSDPGSGRSVTSGQRSIARWLFPAILGIAAIVAVAIWQPWRRGAPASPSAKPPGTPVPGADEVARVRERLIPDRWQRGDFEALSPTLDRILQAHPENSDAWALRSIINTLQVIRNFDSGTKPLEVGKTAAERALRHAPDSPLAELALGMHLFAMISRGGDPQAGGPQIAHAVAALPPDGLTRYAELVSAWAAYNVESARRSANAWLAAEPKASFPAWIFAQAGVSLRQPEEAEKWAEQAAADANITGTRALYTRFESEYYLRADLAAAKKTLARVPAGGRSVHRVVHACWLIAMAEQRWDDALQELARVPEPMLYDRTYHGPRALLAGLAHQRAGRADAALVQFREAERLLRSELATDADNEELHVMLAVVLASAGRAPEARGELALVEPVFKGRATSIYWGALAVGIAQTHGILGDSAELAQWLRRLFVETSGFPFTPASVRLDPRFAGMLGTPELQALLAEFAKLEVRPADAPAPDQKSIAVLAFKNVGGDAANEAIVEGIGLELISVLGRVPGLTVRGNSSLSYFKGSDATAQEKGRKLDVTYLVDGGVQRAGDTVRIVANLTRAASNEIVWASPPLTRDVKNLFAVQEEIAGLIAQALSLKLGTSSAAATASVNPQAFELYVQGRQAWNQRNAEGYARAEELLNRALALEPKFTRALAALADVWLVRDYGTGALGFFRQRDAPVLARSVAKIEEALALDPNSAEAHASLGMAWMLGLRHVEAERELRRAIALNPNYASAHQWLAQMLLDARGLDESLAEAKIAAELDPLSPRILQVLSLALLAAGRREESLAVVEQALRLQPASPYGLAGKVRTLMEMGRVDEAAAAARMLRATNEASSVSSLARAGLRAEAEASLAKTRDASSERIDALFALGRTDEAIAALEARAFPALWTGSTFYYDAVFDSVRRDPRIVKLLAEAGLTEAHARAQAWRAAHPAEKMEARK